MTAPKKRLMFALLYDGGSFMLSRNFRLQRVGDIEWLERNYNFRETALSIDELVILNVERGRASMDGFHAHVKRLNDDCFVPITAGGGVRSVDDARVLLRSGADKVSINTVLWSDPPLVAALASEFGRQCLVASVDVRSGPDGHRAVVANGNEELPMPAAEWIARVAEMPIGEIFLTSVDRDGTGQGFDDAVLDLVPHGLPVPLIVAGGAGKAEHFVAPLRRDDVGAACTAHLFNFVGQSLATSRAHLRAEGVDLVEWNPDLLRGLAGSV